jgi:hypothetical protein
MMGRAFVWDAATGAPHATLASSFSAGTAPNTLTSPAVGNSSPVMMRSRVVLPAPLRPSSPVTVPASIVNETLSSAVWPR